MNPKAFIGGIFSLIIGTVVHYAAENAIDAAIASAKLSTQNLPPSIAQSLTLIWAIPLIFWVFGVGALATGILDLLDSAR